MMQRSGPFAAIVRGTILVVGIWAIYAQVSVLIGRSFRQLLAGAWMPAAAILLVSYGFRRYQRTTELSRSSARFNRPPTGILLLFASSSVAGILIARPGNWITAFIYAACVLVTLALIGDHWKQGAIPQEETPQRNQTILVLVVIGAAIIVTLGEHRVNWDDAKYLHNVANALEYPDEPMLVFEHLHGVDQLKIYHPSVRLQTYELTVAAISKVFGVNHLKVYYLILPSLWAALAVIAQWLLIRRLTGKHAGFALIATFLLLAVWGGHRSYGAFSFDFVGRGIFLAFAIPALIFVTLDFAETANMRTWLMLFLTAWTGCLLTSTAYAVVPMAICLVLITSYGASLVKFPHLAAALLAVVWCPIILAYVTWVSPIVTPLDVDSPGGANFVFRGIQGRIALLLFGLAPFLLISTNHRTARWLLRYNCLCMVILLSGFLLTFIGKYSSILSWRLLWAIPAPVIIGVGISSGIEILKQQLPRNKRILRGMVPVAIFSTIVVLFSLSGETVAFRNFGWPALKMDPAAYPVARAIAECSKPADLLLAPPQIAVPIAGLIGAPSLIAVRGHHLSYLSAQWGTAESDRRKLLFHIVQGEQNSDENILWARDQILSGSINRIVLKQSSKELEPMREMLRSLQMDHVLLKRWELWFPKTSEDEIRQLRACLLRSQD